MRITVTHEIDLPDVAEFPGRAVADALVSAVSDSLSASAKETILDGLRGAGVRFVPSVVTTAVAGDGPVRELASLRTWSEEVAERVSGFDDRDEALRAAKDERLDEDWLRDRDETLNGLIADARRQLGVPDPDTEALIDRDLAERAADEGLGGPS